MKRIQQYDTRPCNTQATKHGYVRTHIRVQNCDGHRYSTDMYPRSTEKKENEDIQIQRRDLMEPEVTSPQWFHVD
jgi:hypothetical protein